MDGCMTDGWTDRHTDIQRETIIPSHYRVAGYKNVKTKGIHSRGPFPHATFNRHGYSIYASLTLNCADLGH